jgi:hypothetical protein
VQVHEPALISARVQMPAFPLLLLLLLLPVLVLVLEVEMPKVPELPLAVAVAVAVEAVPADAEEACPEEDAVVIVVPEPDEETVADPEAALCEPPEVEEDEAALGDEKQPVATESTKPEPNHSVRECMTPPDQATLTTPKGDRMSARMGTHDPCESF